MISRWRKIVWHLGLLTGLAVLLAGCSQLQLPAIDPTGSRVFLPSPYTTSLLTPGNSTNPTISPFGNQNRSQFGVLPGAGGFTSGGAPLQPAFTQPAAVRPCGARACNNQTRRKHIIPNPDRAKSRGELGEIILTPHRIIAPVGSEVVALAGICGGDGHFVMNQPLEWMLSNNSVGQIVEVGGMEHGTFNRLVQPHAKKFDGQYAWGRTGLKESLLTRGTPTPVDDISLMKGQAFISLSSASPGTTYLTAVAPKAEGWDKRRASTTIHWVDGVWSIPLPSSATAGTVHPLSTLVKSATDQGGISDWKVKYTIVGGTPAEFAPTGSTSVEATTNEEGLATVQIRQPAGQSEPGKTQVRVDVTRPAQFGERELLVESGITCVVWSAPELTLRTIGPKRVGINEAFNYRVEVTNTGDQVARDVVVRTRDLSNDVSFVSSNPKPTQYGRDYEWKLGDISPNSGPRLIDVQLKSSAPGTQQICFGVASEKDQLGTQACAETEVALACLGLVIDGPDTARVGDQATFNIQIVNQCEEALENVVLNVQYDPQLEPTDGLGRVIEAKIGKLDFGQSRTIPLSFNVREQGAPCFYLRVAADGGHTARAKQCVRVEQVTTPQISMQLDGGRLTEVGEKVATVRAKVVNTGSKALDSVILTNKFSDSLNPVDISKDFPHNWLGDELGVSIGRLEPGQEAVVEIVYDALRPDGNAFSEFTVSTPNEKTATVTDRFNIRVEASGGGLPGGTDNNLNPGGSFPQNTGGSGGDGGSGSGSGSGAGSGIGGVNPGANPGGGPIGIPSGQAGLQVKVEALDRSVRVSERGSQNAPNARVLITVRNNLDVPDQNVDILLRVPPGLWLYQFDPMPGNLPIRTNNEDYSQFLLERRNELRPGEELQFTAFVSGDLVGQGTFEVQAISDNTVGTVSDSAAIEVN